MSPEPKFVGIDKKFQPLYLGSSTEVLDAAKEMIKSKPQNEQLTLLFNPNFHGPVISAIRDKDGKRRRAAGLKIAESFAEELRPAAWALFNG